MIVDFSNVDISTRIERIGGVLQEVINFRTKLSNGNLVSAYFLMDETLLGACCKFSELCDRHSNNGGPDNV